MPRGCAKAPVSPRAPRAREKRGDRGSTKKIVLAEKKFPSPSTISVLQKNCAAILPRQKSTSCNKEERISARFRKGEQFPNYDFCPPPLRRRRRLPQPLAAERGAGAIGQPGERKTGERNNCPTHCLQTRAARLFLVKIHSAKKAFEVLKSSFRCLRTPLLRARAPPTCRTDAGTTLSCPGWPRR